MYIRCQSQCFIGMRAAEVASVRRGQGLPLAEHRQFHNRPTSRHS